jgi:uncharacterized protein (TIGR00730 family)
MSKKPSHVDPRFPINEFTTGEAWRLFKIMGEFVEGIDSLYDLGPAVSIFGSARIQPDHEYYRLAHDTAARFGKAGYAVITGGGMGLMRAANQGAKQAGAKSVGLRIKLPFEKETNAFIDTCIDFDYFFVRKVMFLKYGHAFIIMPGGVGTLDEFFETVTLIQTQRVRPVPVILFGKSFWGGLVTWIKERLVSEQLMSPKDLGLFQVVDDPDTAVEIVESFYSKAD